MSIYADSQLSIDHPDVPTDPVWRFAVEDYHEMIRTGILPSGAPIELLEGWLIRKMIKNPAHRAATRKTRIALENVLREGWSVDTQEAITTADSEPEPDVSVVRGDTARLLDRHPNPNEIGLLVEVADSSLDRDRGAKKRIYAAAKISVYWIINLIDRCVEVYTQPSGVSDQPDYASRQVYRRGDTIPVRLDGQKVAQIAVNDLMP